MERLQIIKKSGFNINHKKTRMQLFFSRQDVTGLITNKIINTPAEYRNYARAMVHSVIMTGNFYLPSTKNNDAQSSGSLEQLHGILSYIDHVNLVRFNGHSSNLHSIPTNNQKEKSTFEKDFSDFLFYKYCYAPTKPLVICEGKTDNIYLKCAINSLHSSYPNLCSKTNGKIKYKVDFFKYSRDHGGDSQKGRLLGLRGGSDNLKKFIAEYPKRCERIRAPGKIYPVIILIDNDSGASQIFGYIKKHLKLKEPIEGKESFYYIGNNIYVVAIPKLPEKKHTAIEDYFKKTVLNQKLSGKKFNPSNEYSGVRTYGKKVFAKNIVAKKSSAIDFSKSSAILDRLNLVIEDYKKRK